jgi:hypothetical protein
MKKQKVVSPPPELERESDLTTPTDIFNFFNQIAQPDFQLDTIRFLRNLHDSLTEDQD